MCSTRGGSGPWSSVVAELEGLAGADVTRWSDAQVRDGVLALLRAHHQLTALVSAVVASFDTRDLADPDGYKATRSWLCAYGRMSQGAATGWLRRGRLQRDLPELAAARAGDASPEQLRLVDDLCRKVGTDPVRDCDSTLAELATHATPAEVGAVCERIRAWIDPDGPEPDPKAHQRRELSLSRQGSLVQLRGQLDLEGAAVVHTALDAWMTPPGPDDLRSAAHRRADALVELLRHALTHGQTPTVGGVRPQLGLLLTPDTLRNLRLLPPADPTRGWRRGTTLHATRRGWPAHRRRGGRSVGRTAGRARTALAELGRHYSHHHRAATRLRQ